MVVDYPAMSSVNFRFVIDEPVRPEVRASGAETGVEEMACHWP